MQLKKPSHPSRGVPTAISCLATLLKEPMVRSSFVQADGVKLLIPLISPASTQQSIQVSFFLFWMARKCQFFSNKNWSILVVPSCKLGVLEVKIIFNNPKITASLCYSFCMKLVSVFGFCHTMNLRLSTWLLQEPCLAS